VLHLHGLDDHQSLALLDAGIAVHQHRDHAPGHGRHQQSRASVLPGADSIAILATHAQVPSESSGVQFLETSLDQLRFMEQLVEPNRLRDRMLP
jgi:hypothetical protein